MISSLVHVQYLLMRIDLILLITLPISEHTLTVQVKLKDSGQRLYALANVVDIYHLPIFDWNQIFLM